MSDFMRQIERLYAEADAARNRQPEPQYGFWLGDLAHWPYARWMERLPDGYDPVDGRWMMNVARR